MSSYSHRPAAGGVSGAVIALIVDQNEIRKGPDSLDQLATDGMRDDIRLVRAGTAATTAARRRPAGSFTLSSAITQNRAGQPVEPDGDRNRAERDHLM